MENLKVLVFDIETSPLLAYVWERREQNINVDQIKDDWYIMAWSAKWLNDPPEKIIYRDQRHIRPMNNDKKILQDLWLLLDEADIVITQNGKKFDSPKLNARFIYHGMKPPKPYKHLDTYEIVRRVAQFTSNSLEYLTGKLCTKYHKLKHHKFPGLSLWIECMAGNKQAWEEMKLYNIHDVLSTEEFYTKIQAWIPNNHPTVYHIQDPSTECGTCGKNNRLQSRGVTKTRTYYYKRYQCQNCGKWQNGPKEKLLK